MKFVKLLIFETIAKPESKIIDDEIRTYDLLPKIFLKKKVFDSKNEKLLIFVIKKMISIAVIFFVLYNSLHVSSNF